MPNLQSPSTFAHWLLSLDACSGDQPHTTFMPDLAGKMQLLHCLGFLSLSQIYSDPFLFFFSRMFEFEKRMPEFASFSRKRPVRQHTHIFCVERSNGKSLQIGLTASLQAAKSGVSCSVNYPRERKNTHFSFERLYSKKKKMLLFFFLF
jgi:hypothetical protein